MKKLKLFFLLFLTILSSCTPNSENEEIVSDKISIEIGISNEEFEIDKPISFTVKSNQNIREICISIDNWKSTTCRLAFDGENLGKSMVINLSRDKIGPNTIYISIENEKFEKMKKNFQVEIIKGESVKITAIKLISFKNINGSWDTEYSDTDINRLADLIFGLQKDYIQTSFDGIKYSRKTWFISDVLLNQGNLNWNLTDQGLYINPNFKFTFGLGDDDGNGIGQDILLGPPSDLEFSFKDFIQDKPNTVTLKKTDVELEVEFELEW